MDRLSGVTAWPSITEQVYRRVRDLLLEGGYGPGERLSEVTLAERLEVSRGPVREALERLAQEGLVVRVPRRGTYVRHYARSEVRELMELRRVLETAAARLATERAGDEALERMRALQQAADVMVGSGSGYPPDKDFHQAVVRLAGNGALERSAGLVYDQLRLARSLSAQRNGRAREAWREHAAILRALLARDEAAVEAAVAAHLAAAEEAILASVGDADADDDGPKRGTTPVEPIGRSR
ncbi:MAG TPA: GntR family transcriptional regulator [Trueperaceae bacterium]|nr:GntR family transcriptional regulator [Trueperaceae bacterium]